MENQNFKIVNFHAENVKKLKVIDITPNPESPLVTIAGRNGQGKTSILDSILWALRGKDEIQDMPIRQGEDKAVITLDLGEYMVKRTFTEKGTYLTVEDKKGFKTSAPQKILDDMMGNVTFDPLDFMRQKPKDQYETLKSLVSLSVDIEDLDAKNADDFSERTHVNRRVKELQAQIVAYNIPDETPDELVDVAEISKEIRDIEDAKRQLEAEKDSKKVNDETIATLEENLALAKQRNIEISGKIEELSADPILKKDKGLLEQKLENATQINSNVEAKRQKNGKSVQLEEYEQEAADYTAAIEKRKKEKLEALQAAEFPIDGLSFENGMVYFNDVPMDQISAAEQIKVSTAIGMAINPKLKVMRIKDGSLLDDSSLGIISHLAHENDFQVWVECVKSDDPTAVIIEDGEISNA